VFTDILTATDLVRTADPAVLAAAGIAGQFSAKLHILHVLESGDTRNRRRVRHFLTGDEIDTGDAYEKQVQDEIHAVYNGILDPSVDGDIRVVPGFPWEEILRWSRQLDAGLIVLGPHSGRAAEKGVIRVAGKIGSTVEAVIMRENCPVMIINPGVDTATAEFKRIVVGIDFSVSCECALTFAARLARQSNGRVFPMHMIPVPPYPKYSREDYAADAAAVKQRMADFCGPFLADVAHEYKIRAGALPHQEIIACAAESEADLIVMGSHTKEHQGKWYAGSAVERTGYRAACPVAVVTDPAALIPWEGKDLPQAIGRQKDRGIHIFSRDRTV
jgi:nucleotide-binding universal stress UspA family protein